MQYYKLDCLLFGQVFDEIQYYYSKNNRYHSFYQHMKPFQYTQAKMIMSWFDDLEINYVYSLQTVFNYFMYLKRNLKVQPLLFPANLTKEFIKKSLGVDTIFRNNYKNNNSDYKVMYPFFITGVATYLKLREKYNPVEINEMVLDYKSKILNDFKNKKYQNKELKSLQSNILEKASNDSDIWKLLLKFWGIISIPDIILLFDEESYKYVASIHNFTNEDYIGYLNVNTNKNGYLDRNITTKYYINYWKLRKADKNLWKIRN